MFIFTVFKPWNEIDFNLDMVFNINNTASFRTATYCAIELYLAHCLVLMSINRQQPRYKKSPPGDIVNERTNKKFILSLTYASANTSQSRSLFRRSGSIPLWGDPIPLSMPNRWMSRWCHPRFRRDESILFQTLQLYQSIDTQKDMERSTTSRPNPFLK